MSEHDTPTPAELYERANPVPWFAFWRTRQPTALTLAVAALEQCRKDRLEHAHAQEFHAAHLGALNKREQRLEAEVARLSQTQKKSTSDLQADA